MGSCNYLDQCEPYHSDGESVVEYCDLDPTLGPTHGPTTTPSPDPTGSPSTAPTHIPSAALTVMPTGSPSTAPTHVPSAAPTVVPSSLYSSAPTTEPSHTLPTSNPTTYFQRSYAVTVETESVESLMNNDYSSLLALDVLDDTVTTLKFPFAFNYFGEYYGYGYLSSNGLLTFANGCDDDFSDCDNLVGVDLSSKQSNAQDMHESLRSVKKVSRESSVRTRTTPPPLLGGGDTTKALKWQYQKDKGESSVDFESASGIHIAVLPFDLPEEDMEQLLATLRDNDDVIAVKSYRHLRMLSVHVSNEGVLHTLRSHPHVMSLGPESVVKLASTWGLDRIDQKDLPLDHHSYKPPTDSNGGQGVSVYILDTGIDTNHEQFSNTGDREVMNIFNSYGDVTTDTDDNGHGEYMYHHTLFLYYRQAYVTMFTCCIDNEDIYNTNKMLNALGRVVVVVFATN
jgi:subtilisin family serine protease